MKKNIALVFGGKSAEHEISVISARNVANALDKNLFNPIYLGISIQGTWYLLPSLDSFAKFKRLNDEELSSYNTACITLQNNKPQIVDLKNMKTEKIDAAFAIMHGPQGEDGCIQGLFKIMNLPFVGCGVASSAIGMDKEIMKRLLKEAHIPSAHYVLLTPNNTPSYIEITKKIGSPFFIKPANMGSSVGVHKIKSEEDFNLKIKDAFLYDTKVLAEEFIKGREIEVAVLGHNRSAKASIAGEIIPHHEFYSYEAKYLDDNGAGLEIPAKLTPEQQTIVQKLAVETFKVLECEGLSRVDFFFRNNTDFLVNEINTIPGFTSISMYPKLWGATGVSYTDLITQLIHLAIEKHNEEASLQVAYKLLK